MNKKIIFHRKFKFRQKLILILQVLQLKKTQSTQITFKHIETCFDQWRTVNFEENFYQLKRAIHELHILGTNLFEAERELKLHGFNALNCSSLNLPEHVEFASSSLEPYPICNYQESGKILRSARGKPYSCYYFQTCNDNVDSGDSFVDEWIHETCDKSKTTSKFHFGKNVEYVTKVGGHPSFCQTWPEIDEDTEKIEGFCENESSFCEIEKSGTEAEYFQPDLPHSSDPTKIVPNIETMSKITQIPKLPQKPQSFSKSRAFPKAVVSESTFNKYWYTDDNYKKFKSNFAWAYICDIHGRLVTIPWNSSIYDTTDDYDFRTRPFWLEAVFSSSHLPVRLTFIIDSSSSSHLRHPGLPQDITLFQLFRIITISIIEKLMGNIKVGVFITKKDGSLYPVKRPGKGMNPFGGKLQNWQLITSNLSMTLNQMIEKSTFEKSMFDFDSASKFSSKVLEELLQNNMRDKINLREEPPPFEENSAKKSEEHMIFYLSSKIPDASNLEFVKNKVNIQKTPRTKFFSLVFTDEKLPDLTAFSKVITEKLCGHETNGSVPPSGFFYDPVNPPCKSLAFTTRISPQNILVYDSTRKTYSGDKVLATPAFQQIVKEIYRTSHDFDRIHLSTPYRDAFIDGGVMVMTACKMIAEKREDESGGFMDFQGMACIDMLQSKLFSKNMLEVDVKEVDVKAVDVKGAGDAQTIFGKMHPKQLNCTEFIDKRSGSSAFEFEVVFEEKVQILMVCDEEKEVTIDVTQSGVFIVSGSQTCKRTNIRLNSEISTLIRLEFDASQIKVSLWDSQIWTDWSQNHTVKCDYSSSENLENFKFKNFKNFENSQVFIKNYNSSTFTIFETDILDFGSTIAENGFSRTCRRLVENVYLNKRLQFLTSKETGHLAMYQVIVDPEKNEKIMEGVEIDSIGDSSVQMENDPDFMDWVVDAKDEQVVYLHYILPEQDESEKFPMRTNLETIFKGLGEFEFGDLVKRNAGVKDHSENEIENTVFNHTYFSPQWRHRKYGSIQTSLNSRILSDEIKVLRKKVRKYFRLVFIGPEDLNFKMPHNFEIEKSEFYGDGRIRWNGEHGVHSKLYIDKKEIKNKIENDEVDILPFSNICTESCSKNSSKFLFQQSGHLLHTNLADTLTGSHITEIGELSPVVNHFKSNNMILDKSCIILKGRIQDLEYSEFNLAALQIHQTCTGLHELDSDKSDSDEPCLNVKFEYIPDYKLIFICHDLEKSVAKQCQAEWKFECSSERTWGLESSTNLEYESCRGSSCQETTCRAPCLTSRQSRSSSFECRTDRRGALPCFSELNFVKDIEVESGSVRYGSCWFFIVCSMLFLGMNHN